MLIALLNAFLAPSAAESSGEEVFVDTFSGDGGIAVGTQFSLINAIQGIWLSISIAGETVAPGFYLLTVLETESLSAKGCKKGSVNLQDGEISDSEVRSSTISLEMQRVSEMWGLFFFPLPPNLCRPILFHSAEVEIL